VHDPDLTRRAELKKIQPDRSGPAASSIAGEGAVLDHDAGLRVAPPRSGAVRHNLGRRRAEGTYAGGVHLGMTGKNVTGAPAAARVKRSKTTYEPLQRSPASSCSPAVGGQELDDRPGLTLG
jgi:hypothetical protein